MATVYKGRQVSLNRPVAIKILSKKLTDNKEIVERFSREALIIAKLSHPNIIHIIDRGITVEGRYYLIMDYVKGTTLAHIIKKGNYKLNEKVDIILQICKALSYAHKNGVIHRDIKPGNILINTEGHSFVSDFGIAQLFDKHSKGENLTKEGVIMGTMAYMSPEQQVNAKNVTTATDIYSLGVVMYEMFTGSKPLGRFKLPTEIDPNLPKPYEKIILKCLDAEPENRFQAVEEMKDQFLEFLQGSHIQKSQKERAFQGVKDAAEKFVLLDIIKENDFSAVYLFKNKDSNKLLVIKKIKNQKTGIAVAKNLTGLKHDNIVSIYGVSEDEKNFIIVMKYIKGGSLKDRILKSRAINETMKICKEICTGLSFAHQKNIIHGNLRPANILISETNEIKITDFGLEAHYPPGEEENNWYHLPNEEKSVSADIFSAGVIFYEMLTGETPTWQEEKLVPNDRFKRLPLKIQMMITKMVHQYPENRYSSFDKIAEIINNILNPQEEKQIGIFLIIIIVIFAVAAALFFYMF